MVHKQIESALKEDACCCSGRRSLETQPICATGKAQGLLMSGKLDYDSGEPVLGSNGSIFMGPSAPLSIDPTSHIQLQQTTARSRRCPPSAGKGERGTRQDTPPVR